MSDSLKDSRPAVCYIDDQPHLDLAADSYIYPINTPDDQFKLYVELRPYQPFEVKRFYDLCIPRRKQRTAAERSIQSPDFSEMRSFVLDHVIGFSGAQLEDGSEPSQEQQLEWIKENPKMQERVFRLGVDAVAPRIQESPAPSGKAILLFGQKEHRINLEIKLYSKEKKREETIPYTAVLKKLTESQYHQYDKAITIIENARRSEMYQESNWDVIEQLCNQNLNYLQGAVVIEGKPCSADDKDTWIKQVPLIHKIYMMAQITQGVNLKNG